MGSRFLRLGMPRKPTGGDGSGSPRIGQNQVINSMFMVRRSKGFGNYFVETDDRSVTNVMHNITGYTHLFSPCIWHHTVLSGLWRCGRCLLVSLSHERHD